MQINLGYQAKTADEFKELATWLRETGVPANPVVSPPKRDRGPNETRFLELSGLSKMRLSQDEKKLVDIEGTSREEIAAQKVAVYEAQLANEEMSVAEMQGAQKPEAKEDDGEDFT